MHWQISGATGSGKSITMLGIMLAAAKRNLALAAAKKTPTSILLWDIHGTLARSFLKQLWYHGQFHRVRFDDYAKIDRTLAIATLKASTASDPWLQAQENMRTVEEWKSNLLYVRGKLDATQNPIIDARLDLAGHVMLNQAKPDEVEEYWCGGMMDFSTDQFRYLKRNCTRDDLVSDLDRLEMLPPSQKNFEVAPVDRILKKRYGHPAIVARCRKDCFDDWLDQGMILIDDASGVGRETGRLLMGNKIMRMMNKARKGCKTRIMAVFEECETAGTADANLMRFLAESRKWNVDCYLLPQNPLAYASPEIRAGVWQNTYHIHHRQPSPDCAEMAADEIATLLFDPNKIHHREWSIQQLHDGYNKIDSDRTSVTKDKHDETIQKGEQAGEQYLAKYRHEERSKDFYADYTTQKLPIKQQLMSLPPGWAWIVNEKVTPEPVKIPMVEEPKLWRYPFSRELTLGDKKLLDALKELYKHPDYQPPSLKLPPLPPSPPPSLSAGGGMSP